MTEGGEEGEAMHLNEYYQHCLYQPPILTPDQQQQIEEDLALMAQKGVYPYKYMDYLWSTLRLPACAWTSPDNT